MTTDPNNVATLLRSYYASVYPHELVYFVAKRRIGDARDSDFMVVPQGDMRVVMRYLHPQNHADLRTIGTLHTPPDGIHLYNGSAPGCALQFDIDYGDAANWLAPPRGRSDSKDGGAICQCTRDVCDRCWQTLAIVAKAYDYVLQHMYGYAQILYTFSGSRGVHISVCDSTACALTEIERRAIYDRFINDVPCALNTFVMLLPRLFPSASLDDLVERTIDEVVGVHAASFLSCHPSLAECGNAQHLLNATQQPRHHASEAPLRANVSTRRQLVCAPWLLDIYREVLWPNFKQQWIPRVLGTQVDDVAALRRLRQLLHSSLDSGDTESLDYKLCALCQKIDSAYARLQQRRRDHVVATEERFDTLVLLLRMMWLVPDINLLAAKHPMRLPFSPHARTNRLCLPLDIRACHDFLPSTNAVSLHTAVTQPTTLKPAKQALKHALWWYSYQYQHEKK